MPIKAQTFSKFNAPFCAWNLFALPGHSFVATQDRMLDLHYKLSEGDDESAKGSISQLRATLDAISHMCQRIYEPMIERHEKSSQIHAALTLLNRHNEALSLPSKVGRRPTNLFMIYDLSPFMIEHSSCMCFF